LLAARINERGQWVLDWHIVYDDEINVSACMTRWILSINDGCGSVFLYAWMFDLCMIQVHLEFIETLRIVLQE